MKLSTLGKLGAAVGMLAVLTLGASAETTYKWKMATTWGANLVPLSDPSKEFAALVDKMSNGRLTVKVDPAEKHKAPLGILDMVKGGQYEMGHSAAYYWKGKDASSMFFTTMPFGMTMDEQYAWFYYGGGMDLMKKVFDKQDIYSFPGGNTGVQMGGWFRKEINSLEDLKGLKMRIPGFAGEVLAKLGLVVTNIAPGELYTSLERGTIDALEWVGPGMDIKMGFHKTAPFYYTGWHEPASEMQFMINKKEFDKLPADLQQIVITAMKAATSDMGYKNFHMSAEAWAEMTKEFPNIKVKTFPKPVLDAMHKANEELLAEYAAKDPLFKEILDSQRAYAAKAREWSKISTYYYLKMLVD